MASNVDVCNQALGHLGIDKGIVDLDDESKKEVRLCNRFYAQAVKSLLSRHRWGFATMQRALNVLDEEHGKYSYVYAYPSGCVKTHAIVDYSDTPVPYEVQLSSDGKSKVVLCDSESAEIYYTADVTDVNLFDSLFIDALAYKLAALLCMPLKGKANQVQFFEQKAAEALDEAKGSDANEGHTELKRPSPLLDSRS